MAALLMGYAQVSATFTLDGSLIDQSPFEMVKRKGFLGGQAGGGVVGVKTPETTGKFFGGFTLNSIGESLGGLLNGGDLSSLKEMRNLTSSRAIPLLSTPQSLLFVDLQLEPEGEKSFSFKYTIPQGLPSSHRGKAIKIVYNLVIGIQGAPGDNDMQAVRQVNVPFRVFSGVNRDGEIYGHDLMQPYVVLRDLAQTAVIDGAPQDMAQITAPTDATAESSTEDFLTFVDTLLDKNRRRQSSSGTLDATSTLSKSNDLQDAKHAINRAILFSNQVSADDDRAPNRFEIARNAKHVAVIILNRAYHRLGETIAATVDFSDAQLQCFSIHANLETTEKVNPALALRSATSISRVTRRVYASHSENTLFAKRIVFNPFIPVSATPSLMTSGVNLNWTLRFEFTTVTQTSHHDLEYAEPPSLLEEIVRDERVVIQAAAEYAECETFEVTIPLTVYGEVVIDGLDRDEVVGLPI
jgi:RAB6A-GEF complex partner protein 2